MKLNRKLAVLAIGVCCSLSLFMVGCGNKENSGEAKTPKVEYAKGTLTDTGFESAYLNLKFTPPENIIMATAEEIDALVDFGAEVAYSDADKKILDYTKAKTVYEMMAMNPSGMPNVSVMVEKVMKNLTLEQYMDSVKEQLAAVPNINFTFNDEPTTGTVGGQEFSLYTAAAEVQGMSLKQEYYIRKDDDRISCVIVSFSEEAAADKDAMMAGFTPLAE